MPEQNDNNQRSSDKGSEKSSGQTSDTAAGQRDASLNAGGGSKEAPPTGPAKEATKPEPAAPVGKGSGALDTAAAVAKGYVSQTLENVKGALTSPATPLGGVVHGVQAAGRVVSAPDKTEAVKQEVSDAAKNLHQALPGTAAREAGYAGLNDLSKGATVGEAATTAAEKALGHAPFAQTTDHVMKAESAHAKGDDKTAAEEIGKAGASFVGEVVQDTLLIEGAARGMPEKTAPVAEAEAAGKGNTQPLEAKSPQSPMATTGAAEGGKGNTQPLEAKSPQSPMATTGAAEGGKGNTQPLTEAGGKGNTQPLAEAGGTPQVRVDVGGSPHDKTVVANEAKGGENAGVRDQDRPALTDHTAGNKASELLDARDKLEMEGKRYDAAGNETPEYQAAAAAHEQALKEKLDGYSRNLQEYGRLRP